MFVPGEGRSPPAVFRLWEPGSEALRESPPPQRARPAGAGRGRGRTCPAQRGSRRLRERRAPAPPPTPVLPCLRGDEDGGGGDDAVRAAEDRQPVSAETGCAPGGGARGPALLPGPRSLRSHLRLNRRFLSTSDPLSVFP